MSVPFTDDLRQWNRDCTGWEPSMSLLQRGADDAADLIDQLYEALDELIELVRPNVYPQPDKPDSPYAKMERARLAILKARGES